MGEGILKVQEIPSEVRFYHQVLLLHTDSKLPDVLSSVLEVRGTSTGYRRVTARVLTASAECVKVVAVGLPVWRASNFRGRAGDSRDSKEYRAQLAQLTSSLNVPPGLFTLTDIL